MQFHLVCRIPVCTARQCAQQDIKMIHEFLSRHVTESSEITSNMQFQQDGTITYMPSDQWMRLIFVSKTHYLQACQHSMAHNITRSDSMQFVLMGILKKLFTTKLHNSCYVVTQQQGKSKGSCRGSQKMSYTTDSHCLKQSPTVILFSGKSPFVRFFIELPHCLLQKCVSQNGCHIQDTKLVVFVAS